MKSAVIVKMSIKKTLKKLAVGGIATLMISTALMTTGCGPEKFAQEQMNRVIANGERDLKREAERKARIKAHDKQQAENSRRIRSTYK